MAASETKRHEEYRVLPQPAKPMDALLRPRERRRRVEAAGSCEIAWDRDFFCLRPSVCTFVAWPVWPGSKAPAVTDAAVPRRCCPPCSSPGCLRVLLPTDLRSFSLLQPRMPFLRGLSALWPSWFPDSVFRPSRQSHSLPVESDRAVSACSCVDLTTVPLRCGRGKTKTAAVADHAGDWAAD